MKDADKDRRGSNYLNEVNNPRPKQKEPIRYDELRQQRDNARADRYLLQQETAQLRQEKEAISSNLTQIHQELQSSQLQVYEWEERATQNHRLFLDEQQKYEQTFSLYNAEKTRAIELLAKYEEADVQRNQYLTLYNETQELLKFERRSKAGIKGWETRRKAENERLKQEIGEMVVLLRESLVRKDEAVNNLYILAERMDKIQQLVDSAEDEVPSTPVSLLLKFRRIWLAIREILAE